MPIANDHSESRWTRRIALGIVTLCGAASLTFAVLTSTDDETDSETTTANVARPLAHPYRPHHGSAHTWRAPQCANESPDRLA